MRRAGVLAASRAGRDGRPAGRLRRRRLARLLLGRLLLLLAVPHLRPCDRRCATRRRDWRRRLLVVLHLLVLVPALLLFVGSLLLQPRLGPCRRECRARLLPSRRCRPAHAIVFVLLLLISTLLGLLHLPVMMLLLRRSRVPDGRPWLQTGGRGSLAAAVLLDRRHWRRHGRRRCLGRLASVMAHARADCGRDASLCDGRCTGRERTAMVAVRHRTVGNTGRPGVLRTHRLLLSLRSGLLGRLRVVADRRCCFRRRRRGAGLLVVQAVLRRVERGAIRLSGTRRG